MTKVNPNNGNEAKSDSFSWSIFNHTSFFIDREILKYFSCFNI